MKKTPLFIVFLVVFIDLIGFGLILPNLAFYAAEFDATPFVVGLLYSAYSVAQLFSSPFWGSLSDRVGRRPVMLASTLGSSLSYVLFAFSNSIALFFISRIAAGIMAGNISAAQAYVADVTKPEERARGMGLIGAAFGMGFLLGPGLGAAIATVRLSGAFWQSHPHALLGFFAASLSFISFLLVTLVLPESLDLARQSDSTRVMKTSVFGSTFWKNLAAGGGMLPLLFLSMLTVTFSQSNLYGAFPLFCKDVLALSAPQVGLQYVGMGLTAVLVQGLLIRPLERRFGEKRLYLAGCSFLALGMAAIPFASGFWTLLAALIVLSVGGSFILPTLASLISKQSDPERYGATLGTSQAMAALGRAIGPAWGGFLFGVSSRAPFLATAVIVACLLVAGLNIRE